MLHGEMDVTFRGKIPLSVSGETINILSNARLQSITISQAVGMICNLLAGKQ